MKKDHTTGAIHPAVPVVPIVHCIKKYNAFWLKKSFLSICCRIFI
jgi:hypothetical protein